MESKVTHKLRVGDVFLEKDGWGKVCTHIEMGRSDIGFFGYVREYTLAAAIGKSQPFTQLEVEDDWVFLFNVCDLFSEAKKVITNDNINT